MHFVFFFNFFFRFLFSTGWEMIVFLSFANNSILIPIS